MTHFGLIGHPVAHSMSKVMHEAAFRELGLDYTYSLFDVKEEELKLFMDHVHQKGLNVTVPLKIAILPHLDELSAEAAMIGSVNTVSIDGGKVGHNTDAIGFQKALEEAGIPIEERTFLVLGAGGAARSIAFKLAMEKARVYIWARDPLKAQALADDVLKKAGVHIEVASEPASVIRKTDVLVNATPVGMHPNEDQTPIPRKLLDPMLTVVDIVYNPKETRLLTEAKAAGCNCMDGVGMLVHQGAEALRIWLNVKPPTAAMRDAVDTALMASSENPPESED